MEKISPNPSYGHASFHCTTTTISFNLLTRGARWLWFGFAKELLSSSTCRSIRSNFIFSTLFFLVLLSFVFYQLSCFSLHFNSCFRFTKVLLSSTCSSIGGYFIWSTLTILIFLAFLIFVHNSGRGVDTFFNIIGCTRYTTLSLCSTSIDFRIC